MIHGFFFFFVSLLTLTDPKLADLPSATEYLSSFVHVQNVALPFVDNLLKKVCDIFFFFF